MTEPATSAAPYCFATIGFGSIQLRRPDSHGRRDAGGQGLTQPADPQGPGDLEHRLWRGPDPVRAVHGDLRGVLARVRPGDDRHAEAGADAGRIESEGRPEGDRRRGED